MAKLIIDQALNWIQSGARIFIHGECWNYSRLSIFYLLINDVDVGYRR